MKAGTLFTQGCVAIDLSAVSKKQLLQTMAELAVGCGVCTAGKLHARDIVSAVMERERLGSTGVGSGVAIPHARLEGLTEVRAVFARLEAPLEYESIDDRPVDLVVLLLAPIDAGGDHLKALAQVSRLLRKDDMRTRLRNAPNVESLYVLLTEKKAEAAA